MKILAITSSYPRYEGDPTAPFVESIVQAVAALGHEVHLVASRSTASWSRPRSEGTSTTTRTATPPRRRGRRGASRSRSRAGQDPQAAVRARAGRRRGGAADRGKLLARAASTSSTCTGSCRTGRSERGVRHEPSASAGGEPARLGRRRVRAVARDRPRDDVVAAAQRGRDRSERRPSPACTGASAPPGCSSAFRTAPTRTRSRSRPERGKRSRGRLGFEDGHVVVAGVGRFVPVKGFAYLVDAHAEALATVPQLRLVLVGDGDARQELEARVHALGVSDSVTFTGAAERSEIPGYLSAADVVAVPVRPPRRLRRRPPERRSRGDGGRQADRRVARGWDLPSSCARERTACSFPRRTQPHWPTRSSRSHAIPRCVRVSARAAERRSWRSEAGMPSAGASSTCTSARSVRARRRASRARRPTPRAVRRTSHRASRTRATRR